MRSLAAPAFAAAAALGACGDAPRADPSDAKQVALGAEVYRRHCASCHGADLEGQPNWRERLPNGRLPAPPHDASGHTWHHADAALFAVVQHGMKPLVSPDYESDMPAFAGTLSDAEIHAVLAFIKSRWPEGIRRKQEQINQAARK